MSASSSRANPRDLTDATSFARDEVGSTCQRCGFPVASRPFGCKNPCDNCGTVYPLGDCSD